MRLLASFDVLDNEASIVPIPVDELSAIRQKIDNIANNQMMCVLVEADAPFT
jgi:hypothetical protein